MSELMTQRHWEKPDQIKIRREPGWSYKFFRKADIERRLNEGWEVCNRSEKMMNEVGSTDKTQSYRGQVLMRMPIHMVEERNKHYRDKHIKRLRVSASAAGMRDKAAAANREAGGDLTGAVGKGLTLKTGVRTTDGLSHSDTVHLDPSQVSAEDVAEVSAERAQQVQQEGDRPEPKGGRHSGKGGK